MLVKVSCPICNVNSYIPSDDTWLTTKLVECDTEQGGCGNYYVAEIAIYAHIKTFELKEKKENEN